MFRRVYFLLVFVRLYFALSPSYIHPDEHFQGPEVIAGHIFSWPTTKTWEFLPESPIRSVFPLWAAYGLPMQLVRWIVPDSHTLSPLWMFYGLRTMFFLVSFVLEDWALQELVDKPRRRQRTAVLLLASSYVTWTYQSHTFSNSLETILVAWSLVMIKRIVKSKDAAWISSGLLGITAVYGVFNRITFPAFIILPAFQLIPHFLRHPSTLLITLITALVTLVLAIYTDTHFYAPELSPYSILTFQHAPILTPLNNLLYNSSASNLSLHGLHPYYTHLLINLPQLLGPAIILLAAQIRAVISLHGLSAVGGILLISILPHQESRFIIPAVPLLLACITLPTNPRAKKIWISAWIVFNLAYGALMGIYHQGGVVPAQAHIAETNITKVIWWKTYHPPSWLLGPRAGEVTTRDLMGAPVDTLIATLGEIAGCGEEGGVLVAPLSASAIDGFGSDGGRGFVLVKEWEHRSHLNLDDMDFGDDGVVPTLKRVVGRRGLGIWRVKGSKCDA
ncbi:alpha 1,2 mannosyltransferase [Rhizina undulata]